MNTETKPSLHFDLPTGEWLPQTAERPSAEALRAWRLRHYHLWRQRDPEMKERPLPQGEPFEMSD